MTTTATKIVGGDVGRRRRRRRSRGRRDVRGIVPWTNVAGGRSREGNVRGNPAAMGRPLLGSANCDGGDAHDGGREELRKRWHAREAKEMARERRIIFHQSATPIPSIAEREGKLLI
jgi:hypothetical protein